MAFAGFKKVDIRLLSMAPQCTRPGKFMCMPVTLQVTPSFKALAQAHPDLAMNFVSEVAMKMGLPHKDPEATGMDSESADGQGGQDTMPEYMVASPKNCSNMDIDSNRRQQ